MWSLFRADLRTALRNGADRVNPLWFFLLVITLFPLCAGPDPQLLQRLAPCAIWVAGLLASLLSLERLFHDDFQEGVLEQLMLLAQPLPVVMLIRIVTHWLVSGLPLLLLSPLAALLLGMTLRQWQVVGLTLLPGTLALSFLGAPAAALVVGLKRGGALLSLLVLPLTVPLLIFAMLAIDASLTQGAVDGWLALLGAELILSVALSPFITAAALRLSIQS